MDGLLRKILWKIDYSNLMASVLTCLKGISYW